MRLPQSHCLWSYQTRLIHLHQHSLSVTLNPLQLLTLDTPPTPLAEVSVAEEIVVTSAQTPLLDLTTASPKHTFSGQDSSLELDTDSDHVSRVTLIIRRGHCLRDLIKAYKDPELLGSEIYIKMRLPNGQLEEGEGIGVLRDCITEFWMEFCERFTVGHDAKMPFIRHDFQIEEW